MFSVSVSGYYDWRKRAPSAHEREDGELARDIHRIFHTLRGVYGSPRIHAELRSRGMRCSRERTVRLTREMELCAKSKRSKPLGTKRRAGVTPAPNVLNREFTALAPNTKWVSDTTFVWTSEGWFYVAVILDLFSRLVVGWAMGEHNDEALVSQAREMALVRRDPPAEMLLHSDQCSPSTSHGYQHKLVERQIVISMSNVGECYDNVPKESFLVFG